MDRTLVFRAARQPRGCRKCSFSKETRRKGGIYVCCETVYCQFASLMKKIQAPSVTLKLRETREIIRNSESLTRCYYLALTSTRILHLYASLHKTPSLFVKHLVNYSLSIQRSCPSPLYKKPLKNQHILPRQKDLFPCPSSFVFSKCFIQTLRKERRREKKEEESTNINYSKLSFIVVYYYLLSLKIIYLSLLDTQ